MVFDFIFLFSNSLFVKYHYKQSPDNANYYFSGINRLHIEYKTCSSMG